MLIDRQNALIEELRVLAEEGFPKAKEEWEKSVMQWGTRALPGLPVRSHVLVL